MFGIFSKKQSPEKIIREEIPIIDFVDGVLILKNYTVKKFEAVRNNALIGKDNASVGLMVMNLVGQDECLSMRCGNAIHHDVGPMKIPVVFFRSRMALT